ncbi:MAG: hypothetical protein JXQ27_14405 [Acidobacteria bacterium]|nr:hypothetical protein [Acidobacteriota bacterium]
MTQRYQSFYQILCLSLSITTDSGKFLDRFDADFHYFRREACESSACLQALFQLSGENAVLRLGSSEHDITGHPCPDLYAYRLLLRGLFEHLPDFLILQGGVVHDGRSTLLITGPPGSGKSTLVYHLLQLGFAYLSDEFCPIELATGLVHPFPRSLWLAPDALPSGGMNRLRRGHGWKRPVAPEGITRRIVGNPLPLTHVVYLDPGHQTNCCELEIGLKSAGPSPFLAELREIGLPPATRMGADDREWKIRYPMGRGMGEKVLQLSRKYEHQLWIIYRKDSVTPDFSVTPVLKSIPVDELCFALLRDLKQWRLFANDRPLVGNSPGQFFANLIERMAGIPAYRLQVGERNAMIRLLHSMLSDGEHEEKYDR